MLLPLEITRPVNAGIPKQRKRLCLLCLLLRGKVTFVPLRLITDHQPLVTILGEYWRTPFASPRMPRCSLFFSKCLIVCCFVPSTMDDREEEREEHLISYLQDFRQLLETVAVSALCRTPVFRGRGEQNVITVPSLCLPQPTMVIQS